MSDVATLKSYLVGLGFAVDVQQYKRFESTLAQAARAVNKETGAIGASLLKWQTGIVGMFAAVSGAVLGMMDKVSMADQEYRLFGERMFMSTNQARSMKVALDALGASIEEVAFDPELHDRFMQLQKDQKTMYDSLGMGGFEAAAKGMRDITFELDRFKVELGVLQMGVFKELFKGLFGDGDVLKKLREWNDWIISHIPQLSKQFSTFLVPILKDTWRIAKDIVDIFASMALSFTNVIGILSGDKSIEGSTFSFEKFATAIEKVVSGIASVLEFVLKLEKHLPVLGILAGGLAGAAVGSIVPGVGTAVGGAVGAVGGGILDLMGRSPGARGAATDATASIIDQARQAAKRIGAETGADPSLIFAQWAHESANFTYPGALRRNNFGGIRKPGSTEYKEYNSVDDFANDYEQVTRNSKRYSGLFNAKSPEDWAAILKKGGYYEGPQDAYTRQMRSFRPEYSGGNSGSSTSISVGDINITQPGADEHTIKRAVISAVDEAADKQTQRNLAELTPVWQ